MADSDDIVQTIRFEVDDPTGEFKKVLDSARKIVGDAQKQLDSLTISGAKIDSASILSSARRVADEVKGVLEKNITNITFKGSFDGLETESRKAADNIQANLEKVDVVIGDNADFSQLEKRAQAAAGEIEDTLNNIPVNKNAFQPMIKGLKDLENQAEETNASVKEIGVSAAQIKIPPISTAAAPLPSPAPPPPPISSAAVTAPVQTARAKLGRDPKTGRFYKIETIVPLSPEPPKEEPFAPAPRALIGKDPKTGRFVKLPPVVPVSTEPPKEEPLAPAPPRALIGKDPKTGRFVKLPPVVTVPPEEPSVSLAPAPTGATLGRDPKTGRFYKLPAPITLTPSAAAPPAIPLYPGSPLGRDPRTGRVFRLPPPVPIPQPQGRPTAPTPAPFRLAPPAPAPSTAVAAKAAQDAIATAQQETRKLQGQLRAAPPPQKPPTLPPPDIKPIQFRETPLPTLIGVDEKGKLYPSRRRLLPPVLRSYQRSCRHGRVRNRYRQRSLRRRKRRQNVKGVFRHHLIVRVESVVRLKNSENVLVSLLPVKRSVRVEKRFRQNHPSLPSLRAAAAIKMKALIYSVV